MKKQTAEELIHDLQMHQIDLEKQIEDLKKDHLSIEKSRNQYYDLYEFAPVGYVTLNDAAVITQINKTAANIFGVDQEKLVNTQFRIWVTSEDAGNWDRYFTNLQECDIKVSTTITLERDHDISFPVRLEGVRFTGDRDKPSFRVVISDISDLTKKEDELRANKEHLCLALQNAHITVAFQDKDLVFQWAYNQCTRQPEDIRGKKDTDIFTPEEAKYLINLKQKILKTGIGVREKKWVTVDSKQMFYDHFFEPLYDKTGNITGIETTTIDLTDQKLVEDALRKSEENLQQTQNLLEIVTKGTDVIIAAQDTDFRYLFFNQAYKEEIKRLTGKDITVGASMIDLFKDLPKAQKDAVKEWKKVLKGKNVNHRMEFGDPSKYRRIYQILHTPIRDVQGKVVGAGEVAYDVTKEVLVDEELREIKEYLDNLITYANAPIIVWDPQFRITLFNRAFEKLTGRKAKNVIGKKLDILFHKDDLTVAMDLIRKTVGGERWETVEIPILQITGGIRTVLWNSASILGSDGKTIVSTIAQGQDITDRKKIESEFKLRAIEYEKINEALNEEIRQRNISDSTLKNTLSLLNASLESTADGILVVDNTGNITNYNQNFVNMWNIPRELLESGGNIHVFDQVISQLKNSEEFLAHLKELPSYPEREIFTTIEFTDGKIFERYSKPQKIGNEVVGRVWSFRDITDRKRAEEKLVGSLQEKEVLLREIHHRVKNNLQLISGLLDMTRMRTADESIYSILTDMMLKIQTMAQIHTRLYESKQFGRINISEQIKDQITALSNIYSHEGHEISCEIHSQEVFLPVDQALPCALVVNEILSNAYKHAFIGKKFGNIIISIKQERERISISVHDNGIGIPDNVDFGHSNSLGLKLIRTLVQHQLKGSLMIQCNQGTEILIEIPIMIAG